MSLSDPTTKRYIYTYLSKKALLAVCDWVRTVTHWSQNLSLAELLQRVNPILRGWANDIQARSVQGGIQLP